LLIVVAEHWNENSDREVEALWGGYDSSSSYRIFLCVVAWYIKRMYKLPNFGFPRSSEQKGAARLNNVLACTMSM
jgi:hypothetical protein